MTPPASADEQGESGMGAAWPVTWKDVVGSTMEWAREEAEKGSQTAVFAAREQAKGRGRSGRTWSSPRGGLYASVLLREPDRALTHLLPLLGAQSVRAGLERYAGDVELLVKWPNDVVAKKGDRSGKIAGVLAQGSAAGPRLSWVVVGFGVNLAVPPERLPGDVDPPAVSLLTFGLESPSVENALSSILAALYARLQRHEEDPEGIVQELEEVLAFKGEKVRVIRRDRADVEGILIAVENTGEALVRTSQGDLRVAAWDVERLRPL